MRKQLMQKRYLVSGSAGAELLPSFICAVLVTLILLMMWDGYNDYRYQINNVANNETLGAKKLEVLTRIDNDLLFLGKNVSGMFKPQQQQPALMSKPADSDRYVIKMNNLTDDFYLSCPMAKVSASVVGLVSGDNNRKDIAIIRYQGKEASYSVSDALAKEVNIVRIFRDRVIVDEHGHCAALLMN